LNHLTLPAAISQPPCTRL